MSLIEFPSTGDHAEIGSLERNNGADFLLSQIMGGRGAVYITQRNNEIQRISTIRPLAKVQTTSLKSKEYLSGMRKETKSEYSPQTL